MRQTELSFPSRRDILRLSCGGLVGAAAEYQRGGMVYRTLGRTGIDVSLLAFGSHTDPADRVKAGRAGTVPTEKGQAKRDRIVAKAFDLGVNLLDVYESEGQWEPAARSVRARRDRLLISIANETTARDIERGCRMFGGHIDLYRFHTAAIDSAALEAWDLACRAKEAGKVRAIGISTHVERTMIDALGELEGIDFLFFPYNFIHARADYSQFLPLAREKGVGLIAMKPLASGSIVQLDPRARPGSAPEFARIELWQSRNRPVLPAAVAELTKSLSRLPDETLCMAAMRFVFAKPFVHTAITGMFDEQWLDDNYSSLARYRKTRPEEKAALDAAREVARQFGARWLPGEYRWLEEQWRG